MFEYLPLGPIYINMWGIFTIAGVWMINSYQHTKLETSGYLGFLEKVGPLNFYEGAPGALDLKFLGPKM